MDCEDFGMEMEDVEIVGSDPITKLPKYIPPCKGKTKVPKDIDKSKVALYTPLFLDQIMFEGPHLRCVPILKLEDWDLVDIERFPHLAKNQLMHFLFHKTIGVTALEPRRWLRGVDKAGLLNLLWVSHYNNVPITIVVIKKLLCLVHDGHLWLEDPIPITNKLIHRITWLPYIRENLVMVFGRKVGEHVLTEAMKEKFKLVKKPHRYAFLSIRGPVIKVATQLLVGKVMHKCCAYEVMALVVALATQCKDGVQFSWVRYLCGEFLVNYHEVRDLSKTFQ